MMRLYAVQFQFNVTIVPQHKSIALNCNQKKRKLGKKEIKMTSKAIAEGNALCAMMLNK